MPLVKTKTMPYKERTTITLRKETKKEIQELLKKNNKTYEEFFKYIIEEINKQ